MERKKSENIEPPHPETNPGVVKLATAVQEAIIAVLMEADPSGNLAQSFLKNATVLTDQSVLITPEGINKPLPMGVQEFKDYSSEIAVGLETAEGFRLKIMGIIERKMLPWYLSCQVVYSFDYKEYVIWIKPNYNLLQIKQVDNPLTFRITFDQFAELQAMSSEEAIFERLWSIMNEWYDFTNKLNTLASEVVAKEREKIVSEKQRQAQVKVRGY